MCKALHVSRQGYYRWKARASQREVRARSQDELRTKIRMAHAESRRTYGRIRIKRELDAQGVIVSQKRIGILMREEGLHAKARRKFKVTTDSKHNRPVAPNLLARDFNAQSPNQKWAGDITYIWTQEGWLYLAVVLDLFSRKVVGWSLGSTMTSELVCSALSMAVSARGSSADTLCHCDRGSQYASAIFQELLTSHGFRSSMSRKGNCWDNAVVESFFHSMKVEAIFGDTFKTRDQARVAVFDWIECFYNVKRRHSSLGYVSPAEFELKHATGHHGELSIGGASGGSHITHLARAACG